MSALSVEETRYPLYPQKRTWFSTIAMSALCQKRTWHHSFDHLVGAGEHRRRNCEAKRLGSLEIDYQLILGRRLHRKIRWLLALEDAIDIAGRAPVLVSKIGSI